MAHCLLGKEQAKERVSFNFKLKVVFDRLHLASTFILKRKCSVKQEHFQTSVFHRSLCGIHRFSPQEKRDIVYGFHIGREFIQSVFGSS